MIGGTRPERDVRTRLVVYNSFINSCVLRTYPYQSLARERSRKCYSDSPFLSLVQASGTGIVEDQTGSTMPGASISMHGSSGIDEVTVSGSDGRFVLEKTPDGQATLVVRALGFAVKEQPFSGEATSRSSSSRRPFWSP